MKQKILMGIGAAAFLAIAACHRAVPVASQPIPPTPVATAGPKAALTAVPAQRPSPARVASSQPVDPRRSTMTPQERMTLNERLARMDDALFDYDKATIRSDGATALKEDVDVIRGILSNYPSQKLVIEGNADERGSSEYNLALGDKRSRAAEGFLITMGLPQAQLTIISYGKERPVCTEATEGCWQKNRRAHITAAP